MDIVEYNILNRRRQFKKRRNLIRRFMLFSLLLVFCFLSYKIYEIALITKPNISIKNNFLLSSSFLNDFIEQKVIDENFFFMNPRSLSNDLVEKVPLLKNVVIRKYLLPENKLIIYLIEKKIWAKVFFNDSSSPPEDVFLSDNGDFIVNDYLLKENIPQPLVKVYLSKLNTPDKKALLQLKKIYDMVTSRVELPISALLIAKNNEVSIFTNFGFQIKCGKLDEFTKERILNLKKIPKVLDSLKTGYYKSGYLDLTLENAAVLKSNNILQEEDKNKKNQKKNSIFNIIKRDNTKLKSQ
jgi:cell division septal protein FtsQ